MAETGPYDLSQMASAMIAPPAPMPSVYEFIAPAQIAQQRAYGRSLLDAGMSTDPLQGSGWAKALGALNRGAQGALGGYAMRRAGETEAANEKAKRDAIAAATQGGVDWSKLATVPGMEGASISGMVADKRMQAQDAREAQRYAEQNARLDQQQTFAERQAEAARQFQREQLGEQIAARKDMATQTAADRAELMKLQREQVAATRDTFRPATPEEVKAYGADPAVSWQVNARSGQMSPVGGKGGANANKLSATEEKEYFEALDNATASQRASEALQHALKLSGDAFSGGLADVGAAVVRNTPGNVLGTELNRGAVATKELNSVMTEQALGQLKTIFGGNPTEGERKILLDMQASSRLSKPEREALINRALEAVRRRGEVETEKARAIAGNNDRYTSRIDRITGQAAKSYGTQGGGQGGNQGGETQPRGATGGWSADTKPQGAAPKRLKFNPATGDFE